MTHRMPRKVVVLVAATCLSFTVVACGSDDPAAFVDATVERNEDGSLALAWTADGDLGDVEVRWGSDPDEIDDVLETVDGTSVTVDDPAPGGRAYFELRADDDAITIAERRVAVVGEPNFRDLGGYVTEDGKRVRWGQLFRSGALADLTDADLEVVRALGIKLVCDLRSDAEVADDVSPDIGAESLRLDVNPEEADNSIRDAILAGDLSVLEPDLLEDAMQTVALEHTESWANLIKRVTDPERRPTNTHCTAGKDRTGWASAVLLRTLGVPEKTVMEDYLLSNELLAEEMAHTLDRIRPIVASVKKVPESEVDLDPLVAILEVRAEYLQAALDAVDEEYGSFEAYLTEGLGLGEDEIEAYRASMLED